MHLVSRHWARHAACDSLWAFLCSDRGFEASRLSRRITLKESYRIQAKQQKLIARICSNKLLLFNCSTRKARTVHLETIVPTENNHRLVFVPDDSIILVGGSLSAWKLSEKTYWIRMDGSMLELKPILDPRKDHGMILWQGHIYVFGGFDLNAMMKSSEKLQLDPLAKLSTAVWTQLPDMMHERANFCPVAYASKIYLCGGNRQYIEAFDTVQECYYELSFRLPQGLWYSGIGLKRELLIFNYQAVLRWKLNSVVYEERKFVNQGYYLYDQMSPAVVENTAYQLAGDNTVNAYSIGSRKFAKIGY